MPATLNHVGEKFAHLRVIAYGDTRASKRGRVVQICICRCDCGRIEEIPQGELTSGHRRRCMACWKKIIKERGLDPKGLTPGGNIPWWAGTLEDVDRSSWEGFRYYWQRCQRLFHDTFGRSYTEPVAYEEWSKLFPTNNPIIGGV